MYCMCLAIEIREDKNRQKFMILPGNLDTPPEDSTHIGWIFPDKQMIVQSTGEPQFIGETMNLDGTVRGSVYPHYPNVDIHECPHCHVRVAK